MWLINSLITSAIWERWIQGLGLQNHTVLTNNESDFQHKKLPSNSQLQSNTKTFVLMSFPA